MLRMNVLVAARCCERDDVERSYKEYNAVRLRHDWRADAASMRLIQMLIPCAYVHMVRIKNDGTR